MKKIFGAVSFLLLFFFSTFLFSRSYKMVDIFICEESVNTANLLAKVHVSRSQLTRVSYCNCYGLNPAMKTNVKHGKCVKDDGVYLCSCVGLEEY